MTAALSLHLLNPPARNPIASEGSSTANHLRRRGEQLSSKTPCRTDRPPLNSASSLLCYPKKSEIKSGS